MPKFTMRKQDSKFGAPQGTYLAHYLGTKEKNHPEYGAGLEWQFVILDGIYKDKVISRTTAPEPTTKNSCGAMLKQMASGVIDVGQEIDEAQFIGKVFHAIVGANSTGSGTRVETVMPFKGPLPADLANQSPAAPNSPPRPPSPPKPPASLHDQEFWVLLPGTDEAALMTRENLQNHIYENTLNVDELQVMPQDQSTDWKPAKSFNFTDKVPF